MQKELAESYLPQRKKSPLSAFELVKQKHNSSLLKKRLSPRLPRENFDKAVLASEDFFKAAVAYLALREPDDRIREVGIDTWSALESGLVLVWFARNMESASIHLGFDQQTGIALAEENDEPHILLRVIREEPDSLVINEQGHILLPQEFVQKTFTSPIEILTMTVFLCSHARDLIQGRVTKDQKDEGKIRAEAAQAHFLLSVRRNYPKIPLPAQADKILTKYPDGLGSIEKGLWYRKTVRKPTNANNN